MGGRDPFLRAHHGGDSFVCQPLNDWLCEKQIVHVGTKTQGLFED